MGPDFGNRNWLAASVDRASDDGAHRYHLSVLMRGERLDLVAEMHCALCLRDV
jgi:hypothetical protein